MPRYDKGGAGLLYECLNRRKKDGAAAMATGGWFRGRESFRFRQPAPLPEGSPAVLPCARLPGTGETGEGRTCRE